MAAHGSGVDEGGFERGFERGEGGASSSSSSDSSVCHFFFFGALQPALSFGGRGRDITDDVKNIQKRETKAMYLTSLQYFG